MILELDLNKESTYIVSENEDTKYIIGIGETDYTIHREAENINKIYNCNVFFKNFSILDKHNYHVFRENIRTIVNEIIWKSEIKYQGKSYKVKDAYVGITNKSKAFLKKEHRFRKGLCFEGEDIKTLEDKIKYVITLDIND